MRTRFTWREVVNSNRRTNFLKLGATAEPGFSDEYTFSRPGGRSSR